MTLRLIAVITAVSILSACGTTQGGAGTPDAGAPVDGGGGATIDGGEPVVDGGSGPADEVDAGTPAPDPEPANACEYKFAERASFVTQLRFGAGDGRPDGCCFDFNGDGRQDNKLGVFARANLSTVDVDAPYAEALTLGEISLLLETRGITDPRNSPAVDVRVFRARREATVPAPGFDGTASLVVDPAGFVPDTGVASERFEQAEIVDGKLSASKGNLRMPVWLVGSIFQLPLQNARLEAVVDVGPNGKGLTFDGTELDDASGMTRGARLGGVIPRQSLLDAINRRVEGCSCVQLPSGGSLIGPTGRCQIANTSACGSGAEQCKQLADNCTILMSMLAADADADGDGMKDAISVGWWIKATSTTLGSVEGCP